MRACAVGAVGRAQDENTAKKFNFLSSSDQLIEHFDEDFLPQRLGGTRPDSVVQPFVGTPADLLPGGKADYFASRYREPRALP